jgi:hypothetical protein
LLIAHTPVFVQHHRLTSEPGRSDFAMGGNVVQVCS